MPGISPRRFPSPLRYPGGKGKIANYLKLLILQNGLVGSHYVEVYAGGASVALGLLFEEYVTHIHINDVNRSIFAFWDAVLNHTDELCRRVADAELTMEEWHRQRAVQTATDPDPLDLAFSTFFLNRTNRSGIIGGGVIGGQHQDGRWKLSARYNRSDLVRRIQKVARFRTRITLTQLDAAAYLRTITDRVPDRSLLYLDPPYYAKGHGLYENCYDHVNHVEIAEIVRNLNMPWVVSYDAVPQIIGLYDGFEHIRYGLSYSAADRYRGAEVMFFSPDLVNPGLPSPANIRAGLVDRARARSLAS